MTGYFTGGAPQVIKELENFRELQSHCAHDLRSQVGAIAGLLTLLNDNNEIVNLKECPSFQAALSSAQDALHFLDEKVTGLKPKYDVIWTYDMDSREILSPPGRLPSPCLVLNFQKLETLLEHLSRYRPKAVYFKTLVHMGVNPADLVYRLGPQIVKIFVFSDDENPLPGLRRESVTFLRGEPSPELLLKSLKSLLKPQS